MRRKTRFISISAISALLLFLSIQGYYFFTADFWPSKVQHPLKHKKEWEVSFSSDEVKQVKRILQQPFSYLDRGAQTFAFLSQDGKYVLKLFKFKHLRLNSLEKALPASGTLGKWKENKQRKREEKYNNLMLSYKIAYDNNKSLSGLLFCHLNPTDEVFKEPICLYDKLGIQWRIPADSLAFILQRKVEITEKKIAQFMEEGQEESLFSAIYSLLNLYLEEYEKGLVDHDHWVLKNTGFDGETPLRIDVGNLYFESLIFENYYRLVDISYVGWKLLEELRSKDQKIAKISQSRIEQFIGKHFSVSFSYDLYTPYQFWSVPK